MSLHCEVQSDWGAPLPFRLLVLQSEHDRQLGQWQVTAAALGLAVTVTWVYEQTPLRDELTELMLDDSWLKGSRVSMPFEEYDRLKADADNWRKSQG